MTARTAIADQNFASLPPFNQGRKRMKATPSTARRATAGEDTTPDVMGRARPEDARFRREGSRSRLGKVQTRVVARNVSLERRKSSWYRMARADGSLARARDRRGGLLVLRRASSSRGRGSSPSCSSCAFRRSSSPCSVVGARSVTVSSSTGCVPRGAISPPDFWRRSSSSPLRTGQRSFSRRRARITRAGLRVSICSSEIPWFSERRSPSWWAPSSRWPPPTKCCGAGS